NSLITKNRITSSYYGIALYGPYEPCTNNTITGNEIIASTKEAIYVWSDYPNNIYDNMITATPETTPPSASPWQSPSMSQSPIPTPSSTGAEPSMTWAAVAFALATIGILGLLLYFKKRKH
ncbi:MAG: NosD domain-containing protein, partial [Candidatus Bathyarchaeia archaeon]